jgi:hypothetical protein
MSLSPDQPKRKITPEERRRRTADRLKTIRLKMAIGRELEERGITTPVEIGAALGLPAAEATKLLTRHQWREGAVEQLEAAATRLWGWQGLIAGPRAPSRRAGPPPAAGLTALPGRFPSMESWA